MCTCPVTIHCDRIVYPSLLSLPPPSLSPSLPPSLPPSLFLFTSQITKAYVTSRLESVETFLRENLENPLDDRTMVTQQLEQMSTIGRYVIQLAVFRQSFSRGHTCTCNLNSLTPYGVMIFHKPIIIYTSSFARFSYSECGLRSLRSLTHMRVMSSLASANPSVAYARFTRSLTWA